MTAPPDAPRPGSPGRSENPGPPESPARPTGAHRPPQTRRFPTPHRLLPTSADGRLLLAIALTYYLGGKLGLELSLVESNVTPLWPPTGIAVAALLLFGRRLWPAVAVAALAVNIPITEHLLAAAVTAAGNTLAPLAAATLLHRVGFRPQLDRQRDALAIVFLGALASMTISATVGAATLALSGGVPVSRFPTAWAVWWTGDAMGVLVITPFLLSLPLLLDRSWRARDWAEGVAVLVVATGVATWAAFSHLNILFLTLPVLAWASWRLQLRGAAPAALAATLVTTAAAAGMHGPFAERTLLEQMLMLNAFNACVALTSFFLAALVSERLSAATALAQSAIELEARVEQRTHDLSMVNARLLHEIRERSEAQEQLGHEEARAHREHQIAETLQRSMLPDHLPAIPGVALAARYLPATSGLQVGGDWYDVIPLRDGLVGLAIGDVAGHGIQAAATMAQVRMALRAYAVQDPSPPSVLRGVHQLLGQLAAPEMVTLLYLVYDPVGRTVRHSNAGHPPALVVGPEGTAYLDGALAPPLGVTPDVSYPEATHDVPAGATLLLYTDGLIERRGVPITDGLDRLRAEAAGPEIPSAGEDPAAVDAGAEALERLCDRLVSALLDDTHRADDVALVAMRPVRVAERPLRVSLPAEARSLVQARAALRHWLREIRVSEDDENELLVACGEACANVVQHAYSGAPSAGSLAVEARHEADSVTITVRDWGTWRPRSARGGGWGLQLMRALTDTLDTEHGPDGTVVTMTRRVTRGGMP